jgi:type IV secretory pathway VirB10-like protein
MASPGPAPATSWALRWGRPEQTSSGLIRPGMTIAPTLEVQAGYAFNVMVTQDLVFPRPYGEATRP